MLDKQLFRQQMERLAALYSNWKVEIEEKEVMKIWYNEFKDYDDEKFKRKIQKYIDNNQYPPTVAGIKNKDNNRSDNITVI